MEKICWAPAKLNLCLHVLGKRLDGYHELRMVMQRISLCDRIRIRLTEEKRIEVFSRDGCLPQGVENIAGRAAERLLNLSGKRGGVSIEIDKKIPVAAGLGGGSSDAATVLMALNGMWDLGLSGEQLRQEGRVLGADVPFFLFERPALAEGTGEVLTDFPIQPLVYYVLVNPRISVSTRWVYQNLVLTSKGDEANLGRSLATYNDLIHMLHNDLESVTVPSHPVLETIKQELSGYGADGVLMSGSGPTVFGVFRTRRAARLAAGKIAANFAWQVIETRPFQNNVSVK